MQGKGNLKGKLQLYIWEKIGFKLKNSITEPMIMTKGFLIQGEEYTLL